MEEKQRWDMKFERLLGRVEKLCEGLAESSLNAEDKADIWTGFWEFLGDMNLHFEKQYPELKREARAGTSAAHSEVPAPARVNQIEQ